MRVLASDSFETLVTNAGLRFCSTGASIESLLQTDAWVKTLDSGNSEIWRGYNRKRNGCSGECRTPAAAAQDELILSGLAGIGEAFAAARKFDPVIRACFPFHADDAFPARWCRAAVGRCAEPGVVSCDAAVFWQMSKAGDAAMAGAGRESILLGTMRGASSEPVWHGYSRHVLPRRTTGRKIAT